MSGPPDNLKVLGLLAIAATAAADKEERRTSRQPPRRHITVDSGGHVPIVRRVMAVEEEGEV